MRGLRGVSVPHGVENELHAVNLALRVLGLLYSLPGTPVTKLRPPTPPAEKTGLQIGWSWGKSRGLGHSREAQEPAKTSLYFSAGTACRDHVETLRPDAAKTVAAGRLRTAATRHAFKEAKTDKVLKVAWSDLRPELDHLAVHLVNLTKSSYK